jgi:hypothetical protein
LGLGYEYYAGPTPGLFIVRSRATCATRFHRLSAATQIIFRWPAFYIAAGILQRCGVDHPIYFDPPVVDVTGSLFAAVAILGAVLSFRFCS